MNETVRNWRKGIGRGNRLPEMVAVLEAPRMDREACLSGDGRDTEMSERTRELLIAIAATSIGVFLVANLVRGVVSGQ